MYQTKWSLLFVLAMMSSEISSAALKEKSVYTITSKAQGEALQESRGFGDQESSVRMMNLMMVEGSGMEGMDMNAPSSQHSMHSAPPPTSTQFSIELEPNGARSTVGAHTYSFVVKNKNEPLKNLKPEIDVYMTSMDMGTDHPKVKETKPGQYQFKTSFSMKGPWAIKIKTKQIEKVFEIEVK